MIIIIVIITIIVTIITIIITMVSELMSICLVQQLGAFQLLEYQWSEGKFDKQTSSDPTRRFRQFYDWGNLNGWGQNCSNQNQSHNQNYHHLYHLDHHHHYHHGKWNLIGDLMSICLVQLGAALLRSQTLTNEPFHLDQTLRMFSILDQTPRMFSILDQNLRMFSILDQTPHMFSILDKNPSGAFRLGSNLWDLIYLVISTWCSSISMRKVFLFFLWALSFSFPFHTVKTQKCKWL